MLPSAEYCRAVCRCTSSDGLNLGGECSSKNHSGCNHNCLPLVQEHKKLYNRLMKNDPQARALCKKLGTNWISKKIDIRYRTLLAQKRQAENIVVKQGRGAGRRKLEGMPHKLT